MYLEYEEYKLLGGKLEKKDFKNLEFQARKIIDRYTFGRLKKLKEQVEEVKKCIFNLIKILNTYQISKNRDRTIQSENIDGYSVNYNNSTNISDLKQIDVEDIIVEYLSNCELEDGTPYLYRGR